MNQFIIKFYAKYTIIAENEQDAINKWENEDFGNCDDLDIEEIKENN